MPEREERSLPRRPALALHDAFVPPPTLLFPGLTTLQQDANATNGDLVEQIKDITPQQMPLHINAKDDPIERLTQLIEQSVGPQRSRKQSPGTIRSDQQSSKITTESASASKSNDLAITDRYAEYRSGGRTNLPTSLRHRQHHTLPRNNPQPEYTILARPQNDTCAETGFAGNSSSAAPVHLPTFHHHQQRQINTRNIHTTFSIRNRRAERTQPHSLDGEVPALDIPRQRHIPAHRSNPQLRAAVQNARTSTTIPYLTAYTETNSSPGLTSMRTQYPHSQTPSSIQTVPQFSNPAESSPQTITDHTFKRLERSNTWNGGANRFASKLRSIQAQTDHSFAMERWIKGNDRQGDARHLQRVMEQELAFPSWNKIQLPAGPLSQYRIRAISRDIVQLGSWIDVGRFGKCDE